MTVAIPTCNGDRYLREAIQSIDQASGSFHWLVVDDRSDDSTLAVARSLLGDRGQVIVNSERLGLAGNWNRCVDLSSTPLVAIFHQDDVMLADHLETHQAAYDRNPELGWVASAASVIDQNGFPVAETIVERGGLGPIDREFTDGHGVDALATHNLLRCSAVTINRSAHAEVGGFDPSYHYLVDWDFWVRVANVRPVAWRARTTVAIRWHQESETHRFASGLVDLTETTRLLAWIDRHLDIYTTAYPDWRRSADHRLGRAYLNRAYLGYKQGNARLTRQALIQALRLSPAQSLGVLASDPRLLAQVALAFVAPGWVDHRPRSAQQTS